VLFTLSNNTALDKKSNISLFLVSPGSAQTDWVRWEIEHLFNGKLSKQYSYQKLLKSDNPSSSCN